jgi:RND family efflux transporter MFP subunit
MRSRNKFFTYVLAGLLVVFCLGSCGKKDTAVADGVSLTVDTAIAEEKKYDESLDSFGSISYVTKNDVCALVEGTVAELKVKEGETVKKGQILAVLRNVQIELQEEQAVNTVESAKAALTSARTKKWTASLDVESRLLSLSRADISIAQKELELKGARKKLGVKKDLFDIGGVTDSDYQDALLSINSLESEIAIAKIERESASLGLRDEDLISAGIVPATDADERKKQLVALNTKSVDAEIESAAASLKNARGSLESVQKLVVALTLIAPQSGIVGAKYYEAGEFVKQNEKTFTIIDTSRVYAVFSVQEQDIIHFGVGSPLSLDIQSLSRKINAKITEISPIADPESGNFTVKALIDNGGAKIKPGMFVKCIMSRFDDERLVAIPETALAKKSGGSGSVFCVVNGCAVMKEIKIRTQKDGLVWIDSGLMAKETVVNNPSPFLKEGTRVSAD